MTTNLYTESPTNGNFAAPLRILIYSRVSSPQQAHTGHSIDAQPEALRAYSKAQGWRVIDEIADPGKTGRNADRVGFKALMEAVRTLRPDAVVVTRLSRFMRNARLTLDAVHELRELGVGLICADEHIDTRERGLGDMFLAILATMAEWESDRLSEYSKDTRQRLIAKGRWPAGKSPYGYHYDKAMGQFVLIPEQAEVVRLIYSLYVVSNLGMASICRELAARAIPASYGGMVWGRAIVRQVLVNPVYAGQHLLGMSAPPIVTQETFDRAQLLRTQNKSLHPPRKNPWPLQNRVRCAVCGSKLKCINARKKRVYRCPGCETTSRHYLQTGAKCSLPGLHADQVERCLVKSIYDATNNPRNLATALEASITDLRERIADLERDIGPLRDALTEADGELRRLEMAWVRGRIPEVDLKSMEKSALERKKYIEDRLEALGTNDLGELERSNRLLYALEGSLEAGNLSFPELVGFNGMWGFFTPAPTKWVGKGERVDLVRDPNPQYKQLREMLNRLQAEVWASPDRLEVRGLISFDVPMETEQAFNSGTRP